MFYNAYFKCPGTPRWSFLVTETTPFCYYDGYWRQGNSVRVVVRRVMGMFIVDGYTTKPGTPLILPLNPEFSGIITTSSEHWKGWGACNSDTSWFPWGLTHQFFLLACVIPNRDVTDASVGIVVGLLAFLFPSEILPEGHKTKIIEWSDMHKRLPWGVILLIGGSSTMSAAMEASFCVGMVCVEGWKLNYQIYPVTRKARSF